ncbi:MAG: 3-dehydroquinate synthase [Saprospiraceae bacterium]|nr:3-dehydroquinate synthase [Saprospiraceae bacterium]
MREIQGLSYPLFIGDFWEVLLTRISELAPSQVFVLVDQNTKAHCLPVFLDKTGFSDSKLIVVPSGERFKSLETCQQIWRSLFKYKADRHSLLINLGGGVIGDMGGFCASVYMRGIPFIQVPTTLLSQVDASVGSKLGVDFNGFKNSLGSFRDPEGVYIAPGFLATLCDRELLSGYAEIVKHALIRDEALWRALPKELSREHDLSEIIHDSVKIKRDIVQADPLEKGPRKLLNFGHTIGHAIESVMLESSEPWLHGESIAAGMICESHVALQCNLLGPEELKTLSDKILSIFGYKAIPASSFTRIVEKTRLDKKNKSGRIMCTLLEGIGNGTYDKEISEAHILKGLEYYTNFE